MALTYDKTSRNLSMKGFITMTTGEQVQISNSDIISYTINGSIGAEGLPLGTTESASYSLVLNNTGRRFQPGQLDNAEIHMLIGIADGDEFTYSDFGVWYVDDSTAPEQSVAITLNGLDALASRFSAVYSDTAGAYPTTIGSLAGAVCAVAGIPLHRINFPNAAVAIGTMPVWGEDTTLRDILSYCAIAAGGFVRMTRSGQVDIVGYAESNVYNLTPGIYQAYTPSGGSEFKFNAVEAMLTEDAEDYSRFALDASIPANATNTIQIDYNPLLTNAILQSVVNELRNVVVEPGELRWGGDPVVMLGDKYRITDLKGNIHELMVTSQNFSFGGGLSATENCNLPSINTQSGESYSTGTNMYDAKGNIRATRISGLDKSVVRATVGHFDQLTAETIETDSLVTAYLSAIELMAKSISADDIETNRLTAITAQIINATINKITAGTITTDSLYAAIADIVALKVGSITAADISADRLAAALADFVTLHAATGSFDFATIENLLANALILKQGMAESVQISNLAVTSANMLSAVLGELILKGEDGRYYQVTVGSDGVVRTDDVTLTDGEIAAGESLEGQQIVSTSANIEDLNAQNIRAASAIISTIFTDALTAGKITAAEAMIASATIPALYTTAVKAIGDNIDLSANDTIRLLLGANDEIQRWFTFSDSQGLTIRKPAWTDSEGNTHPASIWSTVQDETGYHILRSDMPGYVGSFAREGLETGSIRLGDMVVRRDAASSGIIIISEEE